MTSTPAKTLHFTHRGIEYLVNQSGEMIQAARESEGFSGQWKFLGITCHHWTRHVSFPLHSRMFDDPKQLIGGIVWDNDYGTVRTWGGMYNGKIPRIQNAWVD